MIERPEKGTYPEYFDRYIQLVSNDVNVLNYLEIQGERFEKFLNTKVKPYSANSYEPGKWTSQELLGHLIDTERVLSFRALFIARADKQNLPGFEQDDYVKTGDFNNRGFDDLVSEFSIVRANTLHLFKSFPLPLYKQQAKINDVNTALAAMPFIIAGHVAHHKSILKEKYLV